MSLNSLADTSAKQAGLAKFQVLDSQFLSGYFRINTVKTYARAIRSLNSLADTSYYLPHARNDFEQISQFLSGYFANYSLKSPFRRITLNSLADTSG